ncbi:MAG: VapC toxin family PIN domain ribonuclease [Acidobacteria bacterium]|nr:MAG: VapC toxin family PIN domain ribonuclease [Acidobacteriota bacterium]
MSAPDFLDTNILVYAYDIADPQKQAIAQELVRKAFAGEVVISSQVLAEFAATLLHKVSRAVSPADVVALLDTFAPIKVILPDEGIVRRAVEARAAYGIHFYDGMIVAAAERAGCERIWTEDLNAGQKYFGVLVENPF